MKVIWMPLGLKSLDKTATFIEEQWIEEVVDNFLELLDKRIEQLKKNPEIGPTYKETAFRQLLIHPLVTLYYELRTDHIRLTLLWANKQNPED